MRRSCLGVLFATLLLFHGIELMSQSRDQRRDSLLNMTLDSVIISASLRLNYLPYLEPVSGVSIYAGKKTNVIIPGALNANIAGNVARTVFAEVPGVTIWDMSGSGTQVNIGSRGTDTHRSIEMNMRQNGYNYNSDVFGYPEAHYTPPMQGIQRIEWVRDAAALQYGPQFGGMMNYVMKEGDTSRPFSLESTQTAGSFNFFNSFNAVGGQKGKWNYYAYYDTRRGDGWRNSAAFAYHAYYAAVKYAYSAKGSLTFQFSGMNYREQIAGGLTDAQFKADARQSTRNRNFFSPVINIPALIFKYQFSPATQLQVTTHYLNGERNSVQFLNVPNIADTVNKTIGTYNPRQVDRDYYSGFTTEARLLHRYRIGNISGNYLSGGLRFFEEATRRKQKGVGTAGSDFDLSLVKPYGIDLHLHTINYAAFLENMFQLTSRFSITPGVRYEMIDTKMDGVINNATDAVHYAQQRNFPLFGVGLQYRVTSGSGLYGNIAQAYRPYIYANVTPADRIDIVDPNLKDSKGYSSSVGYRGALSDLIKFDVDAFYLFYGDRVGQLNEQQANGTHYLFTTNIGDVVSRGVEGAVSVSLAKLLLPNYTPAAFYQLYLFNAWSYTHARYHNGMLNKGGSNAQLKGNRVEGTPQVIDRTGLSWQRRKLAAQVLYSYVGKSYSDANNTTFDPTGATGIVPAYSLWDISVDWRCLQYFTLSGGINNLANAKYFTRRINMYPGPGILPGDGRSFYLSLSVKL